MDRCAVLVDAGYLLGAAGTILAEDRTRASLVVDYASLVRGILEEAQMQTGLPVLRVLWYDGSFDALPTQEHRALGVLPDVKVRLGILSRREGRVEQKGVDSFLQRDLTALARNRAVTDVVLLGGDEDLRRGVDEAQDYGLKVHLWGVEAAAPRYNQARSLIAEADRRWVIPADWIARFVSRKPVLAAAPTHFVPSSVPLEDSVGIVDEPALSAAARQVTPADVARMASHINEHGADSSQQTQCSERHIPRLRDLSAPREKWQDNEDDATAGPLTAVEIGARYGRRWASRATDDDRAALLALRPLLPRELDGEILKYASGLGIETWEDEAAKFAVRASVWNAIQERDDQPELKPSPS